MKRRQFLKTMLGAVFAAPLIWMAERVAPTRYTEALRAKFYPGKVRYLNPARVSQTAKWAG